MSKTQGIVTGKNGSVKEINFDGSSAWYSLINFPFTYPDLSVNQTLLKLLQLNIRTNNWTKQGTYPLNISSLDCEYYSGYLYCLGGYVLSSYNSTSSSAYATTAVYYANASGAYIGKWQSTTSLPYSIVNHHCSIYLNYIYCQITTYNYTNILGVHANFYYAKISNQGIGGWNLTSSYPIKLLSDISCSTYVGYIYCVGGSFTNTISSTNSTYYATINSSGIGQWFKTTPYPYNINGQSCVTHLRFIYCLGGSKNNSYKNQNQPASSFYAPISSNGIGNWKQLSFSYGILSNTTCNIINSGYLNNNNSENQSNYIFCSTPYNGTYYAKVSKNSTEHWQHSSYYLGEPFLSNFLDIEQGCSEINQNIINCNFIDAGNNKANNVTAPLSNSEIGPWEGLTSYSSPPNGTINGCFSYDNYISCISSSVDYAILNSSNIINWYSSPKLKNYQTGCAEAQKNVYCIGGVLSSSFFYSDNIYYTTLST